MKAIIATKNQGKIEGARRAIARFFDDFEIVGIPAESNVPDQPVNDDTFNGAKNRLKNLKKHCDDNKLTADLFLSIESGINNYFGDWVITNVAIIEDLSGMQSVGTSASFPVPEKLVPNVIEKSLSAVMDEVFEKDEERHNKGGGIQLLTHNNITRIDLTEEAFVMALTKFVNGDLWK